LQKRNFDEARKLQNELEQELDEVEYIVGSFEAAFELSLLGTINSICKSIIILFENYRTYDLNILLRSLFEHFIELKLLRDGPERHKDHAFNFFKGIRTNLNEGKNGNPFAASIGKMENLSDHIADTQSRLDQLKESGAKVSTKVADWQKAGYGEVYEIVYRNLSQYAHPSYSGGISRNIAITGDTEAFVISSNSEMPEESVFTLVDGLCAVLEESLDIIGQMKDPSD